MMVEAEREVPGTSARHCARPTSAVSQVMSSTLSAVTACTRRSAQSITTPPSTSATATVIGLNRCSWMKSAKATPNTTAGRKAISRWR